MKLFLLALAAIHYGIATFRKDLEKEDRLHYYISSDVYVAALILSILISYIK